MIDFENIDKELKSDKLFGDMDKQVKREREVGINTAISKDFGLKKKVMAYSKDVLRIGKKRWDVYNLFPYRIQKTDLLLNIEQSWRKIILGQTGSGKSFLIRGIVDRFWKVSGSVIYISDVKGEIFSSKDPVQEKFRFNLKSGERPEGLPIKEYYPAYLNKKNPKDDINIMQIPLKDVSLEDLETCITGIKIRDTQKNLLQKCLTIEQKKRDSSIRGLIEEIKNTNFFPTTKDALIIRLENLETSGVIGETYEEMNIVTDLKNRDIPVLNLLGYGAMKNITQFYVGYLIRKIINAKAEGLLPKNKKLLLVLDELADFCPANKDMVSRTEIEELFRKGRAFNIYVLCATQHLSMISDQVVKEIDGCFMPNISYLDKEELKYVVKTKIRPDMNPHDVPERVPNILRRDICKIHKDGRRDWFYADFKNRKFYVFSPYSPLSAHFQEAET